MRRSRRKAAEESQEKVRKLLDKDTEAGESDVVLCEPVDVSDNYSEKEEPSSKVVKLTRGRKKTAKDVHENQPSIAKDKKVINQNCASESGTEDSDFHPDDQSNEDDDINNSDNDETVISSDSEARNKGKQGRPLRQLNKVKKLPKQRVKKSMKQYACFRDEIVGDLDWEAWERGLEEWGPWGTDEDIDLDALVQKKGPVDVREPPPELLMPLLPFQKEWLAWSLKQEDSESKGGILADEMGMGKTIQAISLVLTRRSLRQAQALTEKSSLMPNTLGWSCSETKALPQIKATLVICPLVAVIQWRNEIARFTTEGSTKVHVYHGANRCTDLAELAQYDIVLTTYSIVESEHRKNLMPGKERCQWCNRLFYPDRLTVHLRYFCGPTAVRSEKQAKQMKKKGKGMVGSKMSKKNSINEESDLETDVCKSKVKGKYKSKGSVNMKNASVENSDFTSVTRRKRKTPMEFDERAKGV